MPQLNLMAVIQQIPVARGCLYTAGYFHLYLNLAAATPYSLGQYLKLFHIVLVQFGGGGRLWEWNKQPCLDSIHEFLLHANVIKYLDGLVLTNIHFVWSESQKRQCLFEYFNI